ncbi:hypothetical protein J3F83DRAFT_207343 [Trichoderma novae-zelandiae]
MALTGCQDGDPDLNGGGALEKFGRKPHASRSPEKAMPATRDANSTATSKFPRTESISFSEPLDDDPGDGERWRDLGSSRNTAELHKRSACYPCPRGQYWMRGLTSGAQSCRRLLETLPRWPWGDPPVASPARPCELRF